jgi:hypothetical protein
MSRSPPPRAAACPAGRAEPPPRFRRHGADHGTFARESTDPAEAALDLDSLLGRHGPPSTRRRRGLPAGSRARRPGAAGPGRACARVARAGRGGSSARPTPRAASRPWSSRPSTNASTPSPGSGVSLRTRTRRPSTATPTGSWTCRTCSTLRPASTRSGRAGNAGRRRSRPLPGGQPVPFYERDGDTLVLHPLLPLRGGARTRSC